MNNLKDKLTNVAGVLIAIGGAILALNTAGVVLPSWLNTVGVVLGIVGGAVVSYFTGKNADGTPKVL